MNDKRPVYLRVAVAIPVKGTFFYAAPEALAPMVRVGCRVLVPFSNRKVTGYVLEKVPDFPDRNLKEIIDVLDVDPLFLEQMVPFFEWIADYYIHPVGMVIRSALPEEHFKTAHLTKKGLGVLHSRLFHSEDTELLSWIKKNRGKRLPWPLKRTSTWAAT